MEVQILLHSPDFPRVAVISPISGCLDMPFLCPCFPSTTKLCRKVSELDGVLKGQCFSGRLVEAIDILCRGGSWVEPQTYAFLLQDCINTKDWLRGKRIHAQMTTVGFTPDEYLANKLIILYAKCGDLGAAHCVFDKIPQRSLVSWNAMISGYVRKGLYPGSVSLYYRMRGLGLMPDQFSFASVFRACAGLATLEQGRRAHAVMIKSLIRANVVVAGALVDMYFKCSSPQDGHQVFDRCSEKNVITWTAVISGYGQHGQVQEVLSLFERMIEEGFRPNHVTFLAVLSACSHGGLIDEGQRYFSAMAKDYKVKPRKEHIAAMVDLFGRAGRLDKAYEFVQKSPCVDHPAIWGALLTACRLHGNMELLRSTANRFFHLGTENTGKYVLLSHSYASLGFWENVVGVREMMKASGMQKEPGCSWIEVLGEVHRFFARDSYHENIDEIYEIIDVLDPTMKDAGYMPQRLT